MKLKEHARITEQTLEFGVPFSEAHVDGTTIHDVKLLGSVSLNGRVYTGPALADAVKLFEGVRIMVDHPTDSELFERNGVREFDALIGEARNIRLAGSEVRGDVVLLAGDPRTAKILSLAETMPTIAGFSMRARGTIEVGDDGLERVTALEAVAAVELVTQPATTAGLFESDSEDEPLEEQNEMKIEDLTLDQLKTQRPDLLKGIVAEVRESLKDDEASLLLEKERDAALDIAKVATTRADVAEAATKLRDHKDMVRTKLVEAKLHPSVVTKQFKIDLDACVDESAVDAQIADRIALAKKIDGGLVEAADAAGDLPQGGARDVDGELTEAQKREKGGDGKKEVTSDVIKEAVSSLF